MIETLAQFMNPLMATVRANPTWVWGLGIFSLISFIGTLVIVPLLILNLPEDYFCGEDHSSLPWARVHPLLRLVLLVLKNLLGVFFVVMGILLLVLPGQGLLTMAFGILLLDFPGRYRLKRWLFQRPAILRSVNWLRHRYDHPPLRFE